MQSVVGVAMVPEAILEKLEPMIYLKFCRLQKSEANAVAVLSAVSAQ